VSTVCVSDDDLVARARQGDPAAFGALVDRHRSAVYRAALAALGSHAEAEDAAQEAFLLAYRRLNGFRGAASFKTWLLTIAWHQAINRRRSMTRLLRQIVQPARDEDQESTLERLPSADVSPEDAAARSQLHRAIRAAIRSLAPKLRDALLLAQSGDHSYAEIGAMLDVPVGTIKWRVSEARKLVKARLRERGYDHVG
jgi:RNA polymerase sigma-70 factor (ECF subfamily)